MKGSLYKAHHFAQIVAWVLVGNAVKSNFPSPMVSPPTYAEPPSLKQLGTKKPDEVLRASDRRPRDFRYAISGLSATFDTSVRHPFVKVEVGGRVEEFDTGDPIPELPLDGNSGEEDADENAQGNVKVKEEPIVSSGIGVLNAKLFGTREIYYSLCKRNAGVQQEALVWKDVFRGVWNGSYEDLEKQDIRIEIWDRTLTGPNYLVGRAAIPLRKIVEGDVMNEVLLHDPLKREFQSAIVNFTAVFEEEFDFVIDLRKWEISARKQLNDAKRHLRLFVAPVIHFQMPRKTMWGALRGLAGAFGNSFSGYPWHGRVPIVSWPGAMLVSWNAIPRMSSLSTNFEPNTSESNILAMEDANSSNAPVRKRSLFSRKHNKPSGRLMYRGTRGMLEQESVSITVNDHNGSLPKLSTTVSMAGVLDYGYMEAQLENDDYHYDTRGSVVMEPPGPSFRQQADADVFSTLRPVPMLDYLCCCCFEGDTVGGNKANDVTMAIRVVRARGLYSLVGYRESLNPSVTVEWNRQERLSSQEYSSEPFWDDQLVFRLPQDANGTVLPRVYTSRMVFKVWDKRCDPLGIAELDFSLPYNFLRSSLGEEDSVYRAQLNLAIPTYYKKREMNPTIDIEVSFSSEFVLKRSAAKADSVASLDVEVKNVDFLRAVEAWKQIQDALPRVSLVVYARLILLIVSRNRKSYEVLLLHRNR